MSATGQKRTPLKCIFPDVHPDDKSLSDLAPISLTAHKLAALTRPGLFAIDVTP
jgi:hypothetical protein